MRAEYRMGTEGNDKANVDCPVDTNNDGSIAFAEQTSGTSTISRGLERLHSHWAKTDLEGEGVLTKEEADYLKA